MNNNKTIAWIVVAVIVIVAAVWIIKAHNSSTTSTSSSSQQSIQAGQNSPAVTPTPVPTTTQSSSGSQTTGQGRESYGDALNTYKYRIQFLACSGSPGTVVVAKGAPVMLDNRDHTSHVIKAGGIDVTVPGSDYAIVYPTVSGNFQVTCDGGGAALLEVQ